MTVHSHLDRQGTRRRGRGLPLLVVGVTCIAALFATSAQAGALESSRAVASTSSGAPQDDGGAFTTCMRSHGLSDFPGVTIADDGTLSLIAGGSDVNLMSARYRAAADECASLLPEGSPLPATPQAPTPAAPPAVDIGEVDGPVEPTPPTLPDEPR